MSNAPHDDNQHRRPHTPPMAAAFLEFDLTREVEQLHGKPEWNSGQMASIELRIVSRPRACAHIKDALDAVRL